MIIPSARRALPVALATVAAVAGTLVALHHHQLDLTLSHYDARGHLVVARRVIDSITPGWQQIGAVWLPLPHLLNALPVQVDAWYQSGASAVAMSIVSYAVAVGAIASIVLQLTASPWAAAFGTAVFALNPNVLYLQATPMTEPLLLGLTTLAVAMLLRWSTAAAGSGGRAIGWTFALACLTRYEAWPVTVAAFCAAWWARWRQGESATRATGQIAAMALYPAVAIASFLVVSRVVIGRWFVAGGFFVPENPALGHPLAAAAQVWYGLSTMSGPMVAVVGAAGVVVVTGLGLTRIRWLPALTAVSLAAAGTLPWLAFLDGHPFRIRYMAPLIAVEAVGVGCALGLAGKVLAARTHGAAAAASMGLLIAGALAMIGYEVRPLDLQAPMVVEAQWDRPNVPVRAMVTACLGAPRPGQKIMASMGSLGHYMQETSHAGFHLRDFLHEGNGDIWLAALADGPRAFAEWVLIEEKAEGGDMLARLAREHPQFLDGYSRVCEGAGLALYKRDGPTKMTTTRDGTP